MFKWQEQFAHRTKVVSTKLGLLILLSYCFSSETMTVRLCTVEYSSSAVETEATLVEINFSEECRSQMVSVFSQIGELS